MTRSYPWASHDPVVVDQGLPRSTVAALPMPEWDVRHVGDIGMSAASDISILEYATRDDRIVVTLDADFHAYLALSGATRPSVIRVRIEGLRGTALADLLKNIWPRIETAVSSGAMVTITPGTLRIRTLPVSQ